MLLIEIDFWIKLYYLFKRIAIECNANIFLIILLSDKTQTATCIYVYELVFSEILQDCICVYAITTAKRPMSNAGATAEKQVGTVESTATGRQAEIHKQ